MFFQEAHGLHGMEFPYDINFKRKTDIFHVTSLIVVKNLKFIIIIYNKNIMLEYLL